MGEESSNKENELQLIQAARRNPDAFGELYRLYVERVYRYIYSRLGNISQSEDATAQTFLAAFESFDRFRHEEHFASWLFSIAHNKVMDVFRQQKISLSSGEIEDKSVENDPVIKIIHYEQVEMLSKLIQTLSEDEKELLRLRFLAKISYSEIGRMLHRNEEAVKKSTYRLLAQLRSQLEDYDD